ncbi:Crp/Fnr family transcriptional regulator [Desulfurivibrio dismutans]|uniref:Crp/Fnr family transcriptional regulator n=1 Tax=Desulfurivibrio dismutans TaxID=1398908 RepID=UPI0023DAB753|nr:cyclic nucleotide-binding domain-containing protein [Desulfurivibrio alkaliphilus]MDF1613621.1 cyclic nucleotide-binding domain-containing protein [Desulfurivibrio alkaliphilus]
MTVNEDVVGAGDEASGEFELAVNTAEVAKVLPFLEPDEISRLAAAGEVRRWETGQVVMGDRQPAGFLAVVLAGKLAIKKASTFPGRYVLLAEIECGGMVGEGAVVPQGELDGGGTVVETAAASRLLVLPRERLQQLLAEDRVLGQKLFVRIIQILRRRLRGAGERLAWIL